MPIRQKTIVAALALLPVSLASFSSCSMILAIRAPAAHALSRAELLRERPTGKPTRPALAYQYHFYASTQDEKGLYKNFGQSRHQFTSRIPVADDASSAVSLSPVLRYRNLRTDAVLSGGGGLRSGIPSEVYDLRLRLQGIHETSGKSVFGYQLEPATVADEPFERDTIAADATVFYRPGTASGPGNVIYFVNYSTNRLFLNGLPMPGFAYIADPSPSLKLLVGFPVVAADAKLAPEVNGILRFFPGRSFSAELSYGLSEAEWLALGFDWEFDSYLRHGRADSSQRLALLEKRARLELIASVLPSMLVRAGGGLAFGRELFEGTSLFSTPETQLKLQSTIYGSISLVVNL